MDEYSRIVIEHYCFEHNSVKSRRLGKLLKLSYQFKNCKEPTDSDALFLEKAISSEKDPELKKALQDLDDFLFG